MAKAATLNDVVDAIHQMNSRLETAIHQTNAGIDATNTRLEAMTRRMDKSEAKSDARFEKLIELFGGHWRDLERRVRALEAAAAHD